jgi:hypothetical protein
MMVQSLHQKDLAEPGLSASVISKFFRGVSVDYKTANRIIEKLGLDIRDVLLTDNGSKRGKRELAGTR